MSNSVLLHTVFLAELVNATAGINDLLLARVKRMTRRAYFDVQVINIGRACGKGITATTDDLDFFIFRVDFRLHLALLRCYSHFQQGRGV